MDYNLADLFEYAVDRFPAREYLVAEGKRRTYAEMEARANRLAHHLAAQGIGPGDHVGIYGYNSVEWVEALWAIFKLRAVWININYRYVAEELEYLVGNADLVALLHQAEFSDRVEQVRHALPMLRHTLVMDSPEYETALAGASPERDFEPRSGDDRYILYRTSSTRSAAASTRRRDSGSRSRPTSPTAPPRPTSRSRSFLSRRSCTGPPSGR